VGKGVRMQVCGHEDNTGVLTYVITYLHAHHTHTC